MPNYMAYTRTCGSIYQATENRMARPYGKVTLLKLPLLVLEVHLVVNLTELTVNLRNEPQPWRYD